MHPQNEIVFKEKDENQNIDEDETFVPALAPFLQNTVLLTFDPEKKEDEVDMKTMAQVQKENLKLDMSVQKWKNSREKKHKLMLQSMPAREQLSNFEKLLALPIYGRRWCRRRR